MLMTSQAQERDRDASLMRVANFISEEISLQISAWLGQSDGGGDFFESSGSLNSGRMLELGKQMEDGIPAVRFASFVPRVTDEERTIHVSQMRALGFTDYEIQDLNADNHPVKSPVRLEYYPAMVPGMEGWDMGSDPNIGPIIRLLRFSDSPLSKLLTIGIGNSLKPDLVVFYPVHENQDQYREFLGLFVIGLDPSVLVVVVVDGLEDLVAV